MEITDPKEILKSSLKLCYLDQDLDQYFLVFSLHENLGTFAFYKNNLGENTSIFQVVNNIVKPNTYKGFHSIKEAQDYIDHFVPNNIQYILLRYTFYLKDLPRNVTQFNYFIYKNAQAFFGCDKKMIRKKIYLIGDILESDHKLKIKDEYLEEHEELLGMEHELLGRENQLVILKNKIKNFDQSVLNDRITSFVQNAKPLPTFQKQLMGFGRIEKINYVQQMEDLLNEDWRHNCRDEYQLNIELSHILRRSQKDNKNADHILHKIVPNFTNNRMRIFLGKRRTENINRRNKLVDSKIELQFILDNKKQLQKEASNRLRLATKYTHQKFKAVEFGKRKKNKKK